MKADKILQSDVIDIVFENKNKMYGAYQLRKTYNNRLVKSLGITTMLVVILCVSQSWKVPKKTGSIHIPDGVHFTTVVLPPAQKEKPKESQPALRTQRKDIKSVAYTKPEIVPDALANNNMSTVDKLQDAFIGTKENDGREGLIGEFAGDVDTDGPGTKGIVPVDEPVEEVVAPVKEMPFEAAERMPEFPGGKEALIKFMQRNLIQPDIEDGVKVVVMAKFVVNAYGEIVDVDILKSGRADLDKEVMRVIRKMPKWKPGYQNGKNVSVYYKLPVTFMPQE